MFYICELSELERVRTCAECFGTPACFLRTNSHKHRLFICLRVVSDFCKWPRCCSKLLSAALVAASCCSGSLLHRDSSVLSHAPTQDPSFPAWANICAQRRAPRWMISTCCDWYSAIGFLPGLMSSLELPRNMRVRAIRVALNTHTRFCPLLNIFTKQSLSNKYRVEETKTAHRLHCLLLNVHV